MLNSLTNPLSTNAIFLPTDADKNVLSSIRMYIQWLNNRGLNWMSADVKDYRAYLLSDERGLVQSSAKKHMERIRARYKALLHHNGVRDVLRDYYLQQTPESDIRLLYSLWEFTAETLMRLENNTQYDEDVAIKLTQRTTYTDDKFRWLSREDIHWIFNDAPPNELGYRDLAIFGLCLSYGLREAEVCKVTVEDMSKSVKGVPGVEVRHGKGDKQRFVQYDELTDYTGYIKGWLNVAGITGGLVLQGLKPRQLQNRVKLYTHAKPHDLRRTYAKLLHEGGRSVEYVAQQLGHAKIETTLIYLGMISA